MIFGKKTGFAANFKLSSLNGANGFRITGEEEFDSTGSAVSSAGDVNGDGLDDLIIGASSAGEGSTNDNGISYVVFGRKGTSPANLDLSSLDGSNGFKIVGRANTFSGSLVKSAGDINGDSFDDIIVTQSGRGPGPGVTWVVFGMADFGWSWLNLQDLNGSDGFAIIGE